MYEVRKIDSNSWYEDALDAYNQGYEKTLATANTWRELLRKETPWWYIGKGCDIFRNGEKIGTTNNLIIAMRNRYNDRTGRQLPVRLRDFLEAVAECII